MDWNSALCDTGKDLLWIIALSIFRSNYCTVYPSHFLSIKRGAKSHQKGDLFGDRKWKQVSEGEETLELDFYTWIWLNEDQNARELQSFKVL